MEQGHNGGARSAQAGQWGGSPTEDTMCNGGIVAARRAAQFKVHAAAEEQLHKQQHKQKAALQSMGKGVFRW